MVSGRCFEFNAGAAWYDVPHYNSFVRRRVWRRVTQAVIARSSRELPNEMLDDDEFVRCEVATLGRDLLLGALPPSADDAPPPSALAPQGTAPLSPTSRRGGAQALRPIMRPPIHSER